MCPMSAILYSTTVKTKKKASLTSETQKHPLQSKSGTSSKKASSLTQRDVSRHAEGDRLGQRRGLGEEVQVVEGKNELDWFVHLNSDLQTGSEVGGVMKCNDRT